MPGPVATLLFQHSWSLLQQKLESWVFLGILEHILFIYLLENKLSDPSDVLCSHYKLVVKFESIQSPLYTFLYLLLTPKQAASGRPELTYISYIYSLLELNIKVESIPSP